MGGVNMLLPELAEKIVNEVRKLIGEDIIVVNIAGIIIASTDMERVGTFHEGALIVSSQKRKLIITKEDQYKLQGVKAGISFPIFFQNDVIGVIGITGEPEKVNPFGEIIRKMTELLISENHYAEQFDWQSRAIEAFVFDLIQGRVWDQTFLNRAQLLGIDLSVQRKVAIVELGSIGQPINRDGWYSILDWFSRYPNDVPLRWGNERIVILLANSKKEKKETLQSRLQNFISFTQKQIGSPAFLGIGQTVSAQDLRVSYRQAERALKIAQKEDRPVFDEDLTLDIVFEEVNSDTKYEFIKRTIGPILSDQELILTMKELFNQNHSLKNTAQAMHIHINTLHYRLKKVEEMTKLRPSNIHELVTIFLALRFLDESTKF
jgi:carbohydrate diacid regulator